MTSNITSARPVEAEGLLFDSCWVDPIEDGLRAKVRGFIETMIEGELTAALSRPRYGRRPVGEEAGRGNDRGLACRSRRPHRPGPSPAAVPHRGRRPGA